MLSLSPATESTVLLCLAPAFAVFFPFSLYEKKGRTNTITKIEMQYFITSQTFHPVNCHLTSVNSSTPSAAATSQSTLSTQFGGLPLRLCRYRRENIRGRVHSF